MPKLHLIGIRNVEDASKLVEHPEMAGRQLTPDDLSSINIAVERLKAEQKFAEEFNWELLAYSPVVQGQFAEKSKEVFDPAFRSTRLVYLSIPTRTLRALENADLQTVGEVLDAQPKLLSMRNLGERSIGELFRIIGQFARVYRYMLGNLWSVTQRRLTPPGLVKVIIGPLKDRERDVIRKRYGLDGPELTLRETGDALGISRERARQIQNRTMEKLREGSSLALIHDWVDLHLPHIVHRSMIKVGGLTSTESICTSVSSTGFSLTLISDILDIKLEGLFERVELAQVGDQLWSINRSFARLCWDAAEVIRGRGRPGSINEPPLSLLENLAEEFETKHPVAKHYPPSYPFLRLVLKHHGEFFKTRPTTL